MTPMIMMMVIRVLAMMGLSSQVTTLLDVSAMLGLDSQVATILVVVSKMKHTSDSEM